MSLEGADELATEAKHAIVFTWVEGISIESRVLPLERRVLADVLERYGASFENGEAISALSKYTNLAKREGLDLVWGRDRIDEYRQWAKRQVEDHEKQTGSKLPRLTQSGSKISGMVQFLGELTAYAAGALSFEDFKKYTEARALNGRLWQEGRKDERVRLRVPGSKKPIRLSSFPPGFPTRAYEFLRKN